MRRRIVAGMLAVLMLFSNISMSVSAETVSENGINTEIEAETVSSNEITAGVQRSTTESYLMDTTAPYDGDYLLIANTNTDESGTNEYTGTYPTSSSVALFSDSAGENIFGDVSGDIYGYDKWGRGLVDPASFLPEPVLDAAYTENNIAPLKTTALSEVEYAVGDTKVFYLDNDETAKYNAVTCVCAAIGTYSTVWVPADDPIYLNNADLMRTYMSTLVAEFDSQYSKMIEMFGDVSTVDSLYGDGDGKTALICYDIEGDGNGTASAYVGGYFFAADLDFPFSNATGSKCDLLHIDSWQGMYRDTENNILKEVTASKGTIVHEFQHMINFAVNRENDPALYSINTPDYLNEAYSMAAEHLCYGADVCGDRIYYYNRYSGIAYGNVSLMRWGSYDTLSNYSLSYLFGQYIRTQYKNGDTIYRDSMNEYNNSSENLLTIIADLLEVTEEELLLNFRAALFQKNAEGKYGFKGEEWAEAILQQPVTGTSANLYPGAAVVVRLGETHTPSDAGKNISFAGMYLELTDEDVEVTISGDTSITEVEGELQLSASVYPNGVSQSVIFTIPNESDKAYAVVTTDGLVTALANGSVTVRATSVYNPDKYDEVTISISGQSSVAIKKTEEVLDEGYRIKYIATDPTDAKLYYSYSFVEPYENGNLQTVNPDDTPDPTAESDAMPEEGLELTKAGTHVIKVIGIADGYSSNVLTSVYEIEEIVAPFIVEEQNPNGTYTVALQAQEGTTIVYTLDGTDPVRPATEETLYTAPFQITTPGWNVVKTIAYKPGNVTSAVREKTLLVPVATPEIIVENVLGGKEVTIETATEGAEIYYTLDGSEPSAESTLYTGALSFDKEAATVIKAVAIVDESLVSNLEEGDEYNTSSEIASKTITVGKTKNVVSSQDKKILAKDAKISLYSATDGAYIYYTLDGSEPTKSGVLYTDELVMPDEKIQIRAYARSFGNVDSDISEFVYVPYTELESISLEQEKALLYANVDGKNTVQLGVSVLPENAYLEQLEWSSSNTAVVKVDDAGIVTAVAVGAAVITVSSGNVSDTCTVTVKNAVESIVLENDSLVIKEDKGTLKLKTTVYPANASDAALRYMVEMSDREEDTKGVARIDQNGVLTAIKSGVVKVTIEPVDNIKDIAPVVVYVTISNQRSYNSTYRPIVSQSSITLNKKAVEDASVNIYSLGNGTGIKSVAFDADNRYSQYFNIIKDVESGSYKVSFTDLGRTSLRNGTYRIPLIIESEIALDNISYTDTFTNTLKIQVKNSAPRVTADSVRINRYHTNSEYSLNIETSEGEFEILGLADADDKNTFTSTFSVNANEETKLVLNRSINSVEEYDGIYSVKGYVRVQVAGFEEQLVPLTIYIQNTAPELVVDGGRKLLNYQVLIEEPETTVTLLEKVSRAKTVSLTEIQRVALDEASSYYQTASNVIDSVATNEANGIILTWNADEVKVRTYYIPLLVSTEDYVDVPVTVEVAVQRESVMPKVKLESTILKLNQNYPEETASTGIRSISQGNVILTGFTSTPWEESLMANKDTAVSLSYDEGEQCLKASIVGEPGCATYMFTCVPQFAGDIVSDQEITVTVKLHGGQAGVRVTANGSIDVLRREDTAVVYTVNKINFTDEIKEVNLIAPEKTSSTVYDGSDAFICIWDETKGTITVKAKDDYKFIKGKKYAFRFEIVKQYGLNGGTNEASRTLLTDDLSIQPTQSAVRFTVDRIPALFRYVSSANNTQTVNLRTNIGTIESVAVKTDYPLPEGITINGVNTFETIIYDGVGYYSIQPGFYVCRLNVYMEGQMYKEVGGELVQEPISCQVRYRIY